MLADLSMLCDAGRQHRPFGPRYMQLRRLTEARPRKFFIAAGGLAGSGTAQTRARAIASAWLTARIDGGESAPM